MRKFVKTFIIGIIVSTIFFGNIAYASVSETKPNVYNENNKCGNSKEYVYKNIIATLLTPYIEDAINNYYGKSYAFDPWDAEVLSVECPIGKDSANFIIKLKIQPYEGPHNSVGVDNVTIKILYGEKPKVEKFDHIKSYKD